jgi:hydrogenase maturation protease
MVDWRRPRGIPPIGLLVRTVALKTLVLGLGNPILTDDGVGVRVARAVAARLQRDDVAVAEASIGGLRLLDTIVGYDRVIILDAIQTQDGKPGDIHRVHPNDLRASMHSGSTHDLSLPGALALGRGIDMILPEDEAIVIIAVEVEDVLTFGEVCTPAVAASIPHAVEAVLAELEAREVSSSTC